MKIAILGPVDGPIGGQNRLTRSFLEGTQFDTVFFEFYGHKRWYGPFMLLWQVIRALFQGLFGRVDAIYLSVSRSGFGMIRDLAILLPLTLSRAPVIAHVHGAEFDDFFLKSQGMRKLKDLLLRKVGRFIFVNEVFIPRGTPLEARSTFIRNPVPAFVTDVQENAQIQARVRGERPAFGFISTFARGKGTELFIEMSQTFAGQADFVVAGGPAAEDVAYGEDLLGQIQASPDIDYLGYLDNPIQFYDRVDYFIFPTSFASETSSLVVIEALATRTLPLVRRHNRLTEVFGGAPIRWFENGDDLKSLMSAILEGTPDADEADRDTGKEWVFGHFPSQQAWIGKIEATIRDLAMEPSNV